MSQTIYKGVKIAGPHYVGDKSYFKISLDGSDIWGPLAITPKFALLKAREMVDEVLGEIFLSNPDKPKFLGSRPYNEFTICPSCGKGNKNDRLQCWNCRWDLVSLQKPYFGPPSGVFKRNKNLRELH